MKSIFTFPWILLSVILLGSGCSFSAPSASVPPPSKSIQKTVVTSTPDTWKEYRNKKIGFSINYPAFVKGDGVTSDCTVPVPVKVTEQSDGIFFFDAYSLNKECEKYEDGSEQRLRDTVDEGIILYATTTIDAEGATAWWNNVRQFVRHIYGKGCDVADGIDISSTAKSLAIIGDDRLPDESTCAGLWGGKVRLLYNRRTNGLITYKVFQQFFRSFSHEGSLAEEMLGSLRMFDPQEEPDDAITEFLTHGPLSTWMGGNVFASYVVLGEAHNGSTTTRYIWADIESFVAENGAIKPESGSSIPIAVDLITRDGEDVVVGYRVPRDGSYYGPDIRKIFPKNVQQKISSHLQELTQQLGVRNREHAERFFSTSAY